MHATLYFPSSHYQRRRVLGYSFHSLHHPSEQLLMATRPHYAHYHIITLSIIIHFYKFLREKEQSSVKQFQVMGTILRMNSKCIKQIESRYQQGAKQQTRKQDCEVSQFEHPLGNCRLIVDRIEKVGCRLSMRKQGKKQSGEINLSPGQADDDMLEPCKPVNSKSLPIRNTNHRAKQQVRIFSNQNLRAFFERRERKEGKRIDLAVCTLDQVLKQWYRKGLLSQEVYFRYLAKNGTAQIKQFLIQLTEMELHRYNFTDSEFTLMDHRRLAERLFQYYPSEYMIGEVDHFQMGQRLFLKIQYGLGDKEYIKAYQVQDELSQTHWWDDIKAGRQAQFASKQGSCHMRLESGEQRSEYLLKVFYRFRLDQKERKVGEVYSKRWKKGSKHIPKTLQLSTFSEQVLLEEPAAVEVDYRHSQDSHISQSNQPSFKKQNPSRQIYHQNKQLLEQADIKVQQYFVMGQKINDKRGQIRRKRSRKMTKRKGKTGGNQH